MLLYESWHELFLLGLYQKTKSTDLDQLAVRKGTCDSSLDDQWRIILAVFKKLNALRPDNAEVTRLKQICFLRQGTISCGNCCGFSEQWFRLQIHRWIVAARCSWTHFKHKAKRCCGIMFCLTTCDSGDCCCLLPHFAKLSHKRSNESFLPVIMGSIDCLILCWSTSFSDAPDQS